MNRHVLLVGRRTQEAGKSWGIDFELDYKRSEVSPSQETHLTQELHDHHLLRNGGNEYKKPKSTLLCTW